MKIVIVKRKYGGSAVDYMLKVNGAPIWYGTRDDCIHNLRQLFK